MSGAPDLLDLTPLAGHIGAELRGVDVGKDLDEATFAAIRQALFDHEVLVIRDQALSHDEQIAFARRFGELDVHPIAIGMDHHPEMLRVHKPAGESACFGTGWHTDNTFFERPTAVSTLYGVTIPPAGGDTLYASMTHAYETLSQTLRGFVDGLRAVHTAASAYDPKTTGEAKYRGEAAINYRFSESIYEEVEHPLVRTHPETGKRALFANPMFTDRIVGLHPDESRALLALLQTHATRPDHTCRVRWEPGTLTLWDNRVTQHYAMDDYQPYERLMYRVTVQGERPS